MLIDTHRHLGGCIPPWWVWKTVCDKGWKYLGESFDEIDASMRFTDNEPLGFHRFLDKFKILDHIQWTEELIDSSIMAVCSDIADEGIDYCWLDFSINKYMQHMNWHKKQAVQFIHQRFSTYLPGKVGLILSLKYESTQASQRQYAKLVDDADIVQLLFGIDIVGDESYFDTQLYAPIFDQWNSIGKMTRTHSSESTDFKNCYHSIRDLKVTNIAHGINIYADSEIMAYARDMGVTFDLGVSSNYMTGVCLNPSLHPITSMLDAGLKVTIGTDDPVQCNTTMIKEYGLIQRLGVSNMQVDDIKQTAKDNTSRFLSGH